MIIPALDLVDGTVVRYQGDYDMMRYGHPPVQTMTLQSGAPSMTVI